MHTTTHRSETVGQLVLVDVDVNRGHRTLFIHRKGGKTATIPLSPRTARALDLYIGERETSPIFMNHDGTRRLHRHASARIVRIVPDPGHVRWKLCGGDTGKVVP